MKRTILSILAAGALALALVACSATGSTADSASAASASEAASAPASSAAAESAAQAEPEAEPTLEEQAAALVYTNDAGQTVVSHKYGETVLPDDPQRIVSIKLEDLMLALGADMVACRNFDGFYLEDEIDQLGIGTIAVDEEANTVNLEQVLSYEPDLIIIRDAFDQAVYDELNKIAPTIAFHLQDSELSLLALGKALGMEEQAQARLDAYHAKIADAREQLEAVSGQQVAMLRILKKEIRLYPTTSNDMSSFLYENGLGLTPDPLAVEYDSASSLAISMETLPDLTAEHIFLIAGYGSNSEASVLEAQARYEEIKADPLWQAVPAVISGNIYEVDSRVWLTHGILATEQKIDDVLSYLLAA